MKLHEDEHSVTSISDVGNYILRRLSQKKCQNHDRKQQQFTLTRRIWRTRQCRAFIFGHHADQQQVHKIKSKCYLNVLHNFGKKDDVAQIEKIPVCSEYRVSEKALPQFICLRGFDITL